MRPDHTRVRSFTALVAAVLTLPGLAAADENEVAAQDLKSQIAQLRVCSDPNNLPYSNEAEQGFENRLAELIADELDAELSYVWWPQRRGFVRNTLNADACDLVIGVPAGYELVDTTRPYYRSTYVLVAREEVNPPLSGIADPRLAELSIGVHLTGDDGANPPPVHALGELGLVDNVVGYMIYGDYREPNPAARIVDAVATGEIDVAAVWGPIAGYFVKRAPVPLTIVPIRDYHGASPHSERFEFAMAMGVEKGNRELLEKVQAVLDRRSADVREVLTSHGIPIVDGEAVSQPSERQANQQVTR